MKQHKVIYCIFIILVFNSIEGRGQKWSYGTTETYDDIIHYATAENSKELSSDDAVLAVRKIKGDISIIIFGPGIIGNWCKAGFKFNGDNEKYEFNILSIFQGSDDWVVLSYKEDILPEHKDLLDKLKCHDYVIVRLACYNGERTPTSASVLQDYKFLLNGSSSSINFVLTK